MFREVRFEILGPVRGRRGQAELQLGSPQQRAVMAMLLLARGRQVSVDALADGLWGENVPRSADVTLRTYISRLRRCLDADCGTLIESVSAGYVLKLGSAVLDLGIFEYLLDRARTARDSHDIERAARLLRNALGLWQGAPLEGLPGPSAESRRVALTELRKAAVEEKLAMEISLGEHVMPIVELRMLLAEDPFRERLSELLMLALNDSGRRAEALDVFDGTRRLLREELGIDPGPSLQATYHRVLRADRRLIGALPPPGRLDGSLSAPLAS